MGTKAIPAYEIDNNLQARFESYLYLKDFDCGLVMMDEYYKNSLKRALNSENIRGICQEILRHTFIQAVKVHREVPIKGLYLDAAPNAVSYYGSLGFQALSEPDVRGGTPMLISIEPILRAMVDTTQ